MNKQEKYVRKAIKFAREKCFADPCHQFSSYHLAHEIEKLTSPNPSANHRCLMIYLTQLDQENVIKNVGVHEYTNGKITVQTRFYIFQDIDHNLVTKRLSLPCFDPKRGLLD